MLFSLLEASNFRDGMLYYRNGDFENAKKSFELAIKQDHAIQANFFLGKIYLYGEGIVPDIDKATMYLEKASLSGNIRADCYLSEAYLKNGKDRNKAVLLLKKGLERGLRECKKIAKTYNININ